MVCLDTDMIGPYGYCADISRSWICDADGSEEQRRLYSMAYEQIQHNIELLGRGFHFVTSPEMPGRFRSSFKRTATSV